MNRLRVIETFVSIQGEGPFCCRRSLFIRLAGCNLRCPFCDTKYSWDPRAGKEYSVKDLVYQAVMSNVRLVVVTGGEPLLQWRGVEKLWKEILKLGIKTQVETNGTLPFPFRDCFNREVRDIYFVVSPKNVPMKVKGGELHESWLKAVYCYPEQVFFKFLVSPRQAESDLKEILSYVMREAIPNDNVYIMPITGEGMTKDELIEAHEIVARLALKAGFHFSPRMQLFTNLK